MQNEFTSKYKDTIEEARIYIDEFRREIETTILNGKSIRRIRNDIGAGKDNYGVYIRHGNGWHIFFKKHKNHFTVVNLISSSYLHIDVKELYY
ncbi:MAG: hypothetical protein FWH18_12460 [Marinilabiliaceae bacterium]|nr:hypothetical protein [Marinilabiliaceae bacterium]